MKMLLQLFSGEQSRVWKCGRRVDRKNKNEMLKWMLFYTGVFLCVEFAGVYAVYLSPVSAVLGWVLVFSGAFMSTRTIVVYGQEIRRLGKMAAKSEQQAPR